jgi:hypothetical protein
MLSRQSGIAARVSVWGAFLVAMGFTLNHVLEVLKIAWWNGTPLQSLVRAVLSSGHAGELIGIAAAGALVLLVGGAFVCGILVCPRLPGLLKGAGEKVEALIRGGDRPKGPG